LRKIAIIVIYFTQEIKTMKFSLVSLLLLYTIGSFAQKDSLENVSLVHTNIFYNNKTNRQLIIIGDMVGDEVSIPSKHNLVQLRGTITGTAVGLFFDFGTADLEGKLVYGFIPQGDSKHPHPVYFRTSVDIRE